MCDISNKKLVDFNFFAEVTKKLFNTEEFEEYKPYDISSENIYIFGSDGNPTLVRDFVVKSLPEMIVKFDNNSVISCSENHLFVCEDGTKQARELSVGSKVVSKDGFATITSIESTDKTKKFYDIGIGGDQLYFTEDGILHHNTGKTYTVEKALKDLGMSDGNGYFKNTGTASPVGLYTLLFKNRNQIILLDDADGALADQDGRNLLKAATDTSKVRKLAWTKKSSSFINPDSWEEGMEDDGVYPSWFEFKGKVIVISNLPLNKLDGDGALRTRGFIIGIDPTDLELTDFMSKICHTVELENGLQLSNSARQEVIKEIGNNPKNLSLRKMVRALNIRAAMGSDSNWKRFVQLYS